MRAEKRAHAKRNTSKILQSTFKTHPVDFGSDACFQAEYTAKVAGDGGDDKAILDALKKSYAAKVKELEEAEVSASLRGLYMFQRVFRWTRSTNRIALKLTTFCPCLRHVDCSFGGNMVAPVELA